MSLINGYRVTRTDGSEVTGKFLVLDIDRDPHAKKALSAYLESCEYQNPVLFHYLWDKVNS